MIRTLFGLISIDSGTGQVLGMDIRTRRLAIRQAVGFMPEDECLLPKMVGIEFVAYAGELSGMGPKDAMQRAHEVLDYVRLKEERYRKVESYSRDETATQAGVGHNPRSTVVDSGRTDQWHGPGR